MNTIVTENLNKSVKGKVILDQINLSLQSGNVYGFVGKNGSGKTMLFRVICGLVRPTSGNVYVNEKELYKEKNFRPNIGVVIENGGLYPEFTGLKNLQFLAKVNNKIGLSEIKDAILRVGLDPEDKRIVKKYSLGMRQRLTIAQAIMEKPDIILLDEPTNGLDESGIQLFHQLIKEEVERGALIAIASHSKEEISLLCTHRYTMKNGRVHEGE